MRSDNVKTHEKKCTGERREGDSESLYSDVSNRFDDFDNFSPIKEAEFKVPRPQLPNNLGKRYRDELEEDQLSTTSSKRSNSEIEEVIRNAIKICESGQLFMAKIYDISKLISQLESPETLN